MVAAGNTMLGFNNALRYPYPLAMLAPVVVADVARIQARRIHDRLPSHIRERLPEALRDAAMHLPLQGQLVDDGADIIDHDVAIDLHPTGLGIDFHFADMTAIRISRRAHAGEMR